MIEIKVNPNAKVLTFAFLSVPYNPFAFLDTLARLTLSERKIIELVAQLKTSKQIAELLFLSEKTIEGHRGNIIEKLGLVKEKNTLLKWAIQNIKG
nr:helix-turn-helix transcriptional regulator [uncultured Flavobacterium sp.]